MRLGAKNDRKRLTALASAMPRGGLEAVLAPSLIKYPSVYEFTA
jgi:hypothetical protein